MPAELTDKQKAALERFKKLKVGALFMRQGTGKTRVALELVNYNSPDYMLYIAPVSTIENARTEIENGAAAARMTLLDMKRLHPVIRNMLIYMTK